MKPYIKERTLLSAEHIIETKDTIRKTAKIFNLSKSTVHNDLSKRLKKIDKSKFDEVRIILNENFFDKHIRGGMATKRKFQK